MTQSFFSTGALLVGLAFYAAPTAAAQGPSDPCCGIVAINGTTGSITVRVNATGRTFQFKPNGFSPVDAFRSLAGLQLGQAVYANFATHQLSLDGRTAYGVITTPPAQPPDGAQPPDAFRLIQPNAAGYARSGVSAPVGPCCGIVAIDAATGIVTAKINATGNLFRFKSNGITPTDGLHSGLNPGQAIYVNFSNHLVSLDGRSAFGVLAR